MELICQTFPHLRDVWIHHLEPFILPSKEEMDRRCFIVQLTLKLKLIRGWNHLSKWRCKTTQTWYIQPGVIFCSSLWCPGAFSFRLFETYFMRDNSLICCSMEFPVRHVADNARTSRRIDTYRGVRFTLRDNGEIWRDDYDNRVEVIKNELPQDVLSSLCTHVRHCMLMHAVRHHVHTLPHVE
jgi:hypothetical protein